MVYLVLRVLMELGSRAIWVVIFLVVFYMAVIAVLVRHIGTVLKTLLEESDPERQHVLREVLRDLLELFRRGKPR